MNAPAHINPEPYVITVWSDPGCPWATLSLHALRDAIDKSGYDILIDHRAFPLELFNRMPTPKRILDAEVVAIAGSQSHLGWTLWAQPEWTYPTTTLPAMAAVQAAKDPRVGGLQASDALDAALRNAFYVDNACISLHPVIEDVAATIPELNIDALRDQLSQGAGYAAVHADYRLARTPAIQGSPHLFTATGWAAHNPGANYSWTSAPPEGFPRLKSYDPSWATALVCSLARDGS